MPERLTKRSVDAMQAAERSYIVFDTDLTGFGVRIGKAKKTWLISYRPYPGGRGTTPKKFTFGTTQGMTATEARDRARLLLAGVARGEDPTTERAASRATGTVADLLDAYLADGLVIAGGKGVGRPLKAQTANNKRANIENHIRPVLGSTKLNALSEKDIVACPRGVVRI